MSVFEGVCVSECFRLFFLLTTTHCVANSESVFGRCFPHLMPLKWVLFHLKTEIFQIEYILIINFFTGAYFTLLFPFPSFLSAFTQPRRGHTHHVQTKYFVIQYQTIRYCSFHSVRLHKKPTTPNVYAFFIFFPIFIKYLRMLFHFVFHFLKTISNHYICCWSNGWHQKMMNKTLACDTNREQKRNKHDAASYIGALARIRMKCFWSVGIWWWGAQR